MTATMSEIKKLFNVDAMLKRFKALNIAPVRGEYGTEKGASQACLIGSFEHYVARLQHRALNDGINTTDLPKSIGKLSARQLRFLESGWEDMDYAFSVTGGVDYLAPETNQEAQLQELGRALGRIFCGPTDVRAWRAEHTAFAKAEGLGEFFDSRKHWGEHWEKYVNQRLINAGLKPGKKVDVSVKAA